MTIVRYPTISAMADAIVSTGKDPLKWVETHSRATAGCSAGQTLEHARHGDQSLAPAAERLIDRLSVEIAVPERQIIADVAGGWPSVPDFLAGHPDCMRRRVTVDNESAPLSICVSVGASISVSQQETRARGTAILALVLALSRSRPIELHIVSFQYSRDVDDRESVVTAPINTTPLDIASAAYALVSPSFFRALIYGLQSKLHGVNKDSGRWPDAWMKDRQACLGDLLRRLGGDPDRDLILDAAFTGDRVIGDPLAWVQEQIKRFAGDEP